MTPTRTPSATATKGCLKLGEMPATVSLDPNVGHVRGQRSVLRSAQRFVPHVYYGFAMLPIDP